MLRIYQEICVVVSDSVLIIALTLVTPLTEQDAEAKKREGLPSWFLVRTFAHLSPCNIFYSINK